MSIETVERYIQELEAIKNYSEVKREKEELSHKIEELKASLDNALKEVSSLKGLKAHLDGAEMTLEEARLDFIRAQDAEIEKRAAERFEALKLEYEAKMPQLVYQRLIEIFKGRLWPKEIATVVKAETEERANGILYHSENWPDKFKEYHQKQVEAGVKSGLDAEFNKRVEERANMRAQQRLRELKNEEWPKWFNANIEPRIAELQAKVNANALQLLKGPWTFTCDRCGTRFDAEVTAEGIEQLLRSGQVKSECANPQCEDHSLFSTRRHTLQVSLHDLIKVRIPG